MTELIEDIKAVLDGSKKWTLVRGDALDILPLLPNGCIDSIITDPPFGIGYDKYSESEDVPEEYDGIIRPFVQHCERLIEDGSVFVWQGMTRCADWHKWFPPGWRIFAACKDFVQQRPISVQYSFDPVIFWHVGNSSKKPKNYRDQHGRDWHVGRTSKYVSDGFKGHPCRRPLDTATYIVQMATDDNAVILDPFAGSCTIGVACLKTNRRYIGIEIDPKYYNVGFDRMSSVRCINRSLLYTLGSKKKKRKDKKGFGL